MMKRVRWIACSSALKTDACLGNDAVRTVSPPTAADQTRQQICSHLWMIWWSLYFSLEWCGQIQECLLHFCFFGKFTYFNQIKKNLLFMKTIFHNICFTSDSFHYISLHCRLIQVYTAISQSLNATNSFFTACSFNSHAEPPAMSYENQRHLLACRRLVRYAMDCSAIYIWKSFANMSLVIL